jgi:L-alanine-DL-glutamate epimerase-like enolase superfamily enzyme
MIRGLSLDATIENRPLIKPFSISTGVRTHQPVLSVRLRDGSCIGRGQATGISYLGETAHTLLKQIERVRAQVEHGIDRLTLTHILPAGGARSALDAALWDLDAARTGHPVSEQLGLTLKPLESAFTIVLDSPDNMAAQTREEGWRPLLKVKLGGSSDLEVERLRQVAEAAGQSRLIIDANAGWTVEDLDRLAPLAAELGYALLEQPLSTSEDKTDDGKQALRRASDYLPICADESFQTWDDFAHISGMYTAVNIKLDKCGGLTEGLRIRERAKAEDLKIFIGCMLAPTIAIAPAYYLAQAADYVDLDGPFWFPDEPAQLSRSGLFEPIEESVWGQGLMTTSALDR